MTIGHEANPLRDTRDRRITRIAGPSALVFFGVTGDLARKKLLPAVYDLMNRGLLPPQYPLPTLLAAIHQYQHERSSDW